MNARNRHALEILLVFLTPLNEYRVNHPALLKLLQASSAKAESVHPIMLIPEPLMGTWVLTRPFGSLRSLWVCQVTRLAASWSPEGLVCATSRPPPAIRQMHTCNGNEREEFLYACANL